MKVHIFEKMIVKIFMCLSIIKVEFEKSVQLIIVIMVDSKKKSVKTLNPYCDAMKK